MLSSYFDVLFWRSSKNNSSTESTPVDSNPTDSSSSPTATPNVVGSDSSNSTGDLQTEINSIDLKLHLRTLESFNEDLHSILANCSRNQTDCACSITVAYDPAAMWGNQYKIRMNCDNAVENPDFVKATNEAIHLQVQEKVKILLARPPPSPPSPPSPAPLPTMPISTDISTDKPSNTFKYGSA